MADFIYLLQNRLTPAQWRALEAVREAARAHSMPVFLVGGAVRDLTSGTPVRDLDFSVQGDVQALVPDLEAAGAAVTGQNPVLSSVYLSFRGGVRGEIGPSLTVSYPKPGQGEAHPAPILDDLRRRDFTANAMAVSLNEGSYGLLLDPLNGTADIENRELRLVSAYGFIEQPALLLRAARLCERLGFTLEEKTANRYQTGKEEGYIQALPAFDRGYELEEIFHEEDPRTILEHMEAEGWRDVLFPALRSADADQAGIDHVRDLMGQLEGQGIHPEPSAVLFPYTTAKLSDKDRNALKAMLARPGFAQQIDTVEARARELGSQLTSKAAASPSDSWRLLMSAEPDLVLWLAVHVRTGAVQAKIKAFLKEWPQMRQKIPYALMQEMRITPELPEYEKLVDDLFFALIDGKLDTVEATRAFLEPFSPPAPPQVSVRRRPAKSARGRAKRVAEELTPEPADDMETADTTELDTGDADLGAPHGDSGGSDEDAEEHEDAEDEADEEPVVAKAPRKAPAGKRAAPVQATAPATKSVKVPEPAAEATPSEPKSDGKNAAAAKTAAPAKDAGSKKEASSAGGGSLGKGPAKPAPAKKGPPAKAASKPAPVKAAAKIAAKAPAKSATKSSKEAAKKVPAKQLSKKVAAKLAAKNRTAAKGPVKTAPKKAAVKQTVPNKSVAKKSAPAKRQAPAKSAKKVATKARSGR